MGETLFRKSVFNVKPEHANHTHTHSSGVGGCWVLREAISRVLSGRGAVRACSTLGFGYHARACACTHTPPLRAEPRRALPAMRHTHHLLHNAGRSVRPSGERSAVARSGTRRDRQPSDVRGAAAAHHPPAGRGPAVSAGARHGRRVSLLYRAGRDEAKA